MSRAVKPPRTQLSPSWYREKQYQGALVSWQQLIPDGRTRVGLLLGARRIRSGDPRSIRTVLEVLDSGSGTVQTVETWQVSPIQEQELAAT